ncbi:MAG TPA: hypothetical protein VMC03_01805 [Streptosporangiaceae bacterium]|nr:hypothetical protein [Streptosporangiaceae bacterium]
MAVTAAGAVCRTALSTRLATSRSVSRGSPSSAAGWVAARTLSPRRSASARLATHAKG